MADPQRVAVIGGGISGVTAAYSIKKALPDVAVTVFERSGELGGKLRTVALAGTQVEAGADSFLTRESYALDLVEEAGLAETLVGPGVFGGLVWDGVTTEPLPKEAVMGIPVSARAIWRADSLTVPGKLRAMGDLFLPGGVADDDVAVGAFLRRRFGRELTHRMVDPILAGTRSGDIEHMSLRYALPQVFSAAKARSSVIRSLKSASGSGRPEFKTPRAGMNELVTKLAGAADLDIRTSAEVHGISREKEGWRLSLDGGSSDRFRAVIVALPFHQAAPLFDPDAGEPVIKEVAEAMHAMPHASVASIALAYRDGDITWPQGSSGFLVPSASQRTLAAGTWWSAKWPHTKDPSHVIVRCFVGRSGRHPALDLDDDELARRVASEISELTGAGPPVTSRVDRWDEGLPQFELGHHQRLTSIERAVGALPGLEIAGPDLTGSGVPECVRQARSAASRMAAYLAAAGGGGRVGA